MLTAATRNTDFPSLAGRTYLNTAAEGIPPQAVGDALRAYAEDKQLGMDGRQRHAARWHSVKEQVARQYGLTPQEIGICCCASEAYNLAALALQLGTDDDVIINDLDFPAGATPWLQSTCPANVRLWQSRQGVLRVEDLVPLLGRNTRLVTVSLVSFFNGYKIRLPEVVRTVRQHAPALVAVDVTQALGRIPLDLAGADLVVSSTHKWILASHGGGLVGVPALRAETWTVPAGGWFHLQNAFGVDRFQRAVSKPGAASFSVGMPNYPAVYAIDAALRYIDTIGVPAIDAHARPLVRACIEGIKKLAVELITPDDPDTLAGIVAFRHPDAARIVASLHANNIHIMGQAGRLRVSLHGYNTMDDVEKFLRTLHEML